MEIIKDCWSKILLPYTAEEQAEALNMCIRHHLDKAPTMPQFNSLLQTARKKLEEKAEEEQEKLIRSRLPLPAPCPCGNLASGKYLSKHVTGEKNGRWEWYKNKDNQPICEECEQKKRDETYQKMKALLKVRRVS